MADSERHGAEVEKRRPLILEIKGNSLDDGPGIRTVVFFKGCPLSCVWCHNPESKRPGPEISFDARACVGCDRCLEACREGALNRSNPAYVDRDRCTLCFECVDACPSGALSRVGRFMEVPEVVSAVLKDLPFFSTSGGGVTLSGGEPALFMDYCSSLLEGLKSEGVHTLIETCGLFDIDEFDSKLLPHVDTVYFDLKIVDPAAHREQCGTRNDVILENFTRLFERSLDGGLELLPRVPLIPGITATGANLAAVASFLREQGATKVAVLEYNPLWVEKNLKIGGERPAGRAWDSWMEREAVRRCRDAFAGLEIV